MSRRLTLTCLALLTLAACAPESGGITLVNFHALQPNCTVPKADSALWGSGSLDLAVDPGNEEASAYYVGLILQATLSPGSNAPLTVGTVTLELSNSDVPVIDEKVLTYTSTPRLAAIKEYHEAMNLKFDFGSNNGSILVGGENLISRDVPGGSLNYASEVLRRTLLDAVDLRVHLEYRGHMSRSGAAVSSGVNVAPLMVYNTTSLSGCAIPRTFVGTCPALGQDVSVAPTCCDTAPAGTSGCP